MNSTAPGWKQGSDVSDLLKAFEELALPKLEDLPEFIEEMERKAQEMQQAEARKAEMEARYPEAAALDNRPRGPESMLRMQELLAKMATSSVKKIGAKP